METFTAPTAPGTTAEPSPRQPHSPFRRNASATVVRLTPARKTLTWPAVELSTGRYTLGSSPSCDVVLPFSGVAPRHCTLVVGQQHNVLKAWSPLTWINDGVVTEGLLRTGDRLILGPIELRVESATEETSSYTTAPGNAAPPPGHATAPTRRFTESIGTASHGEKRPLAALHPSAASLSRRREEQTRELLAAVQETLNDVLSRERALRDETSRQRLVLQHRAQELDAQWKEFEDRKDLAAKEADIQQLTELQKFEQMLAKRQTELAGRSHELVQRHRQLSAEARSLAQRQLEVESYYAELGEAREAVRLQSARNNAQQRQLSARQIDLDRRHDALHAQQASLLEDRQKSAQQSRRLEEEQARREAQIHRRERMLDELEQTLSERVEELTAETERLDAIKAEQVQSQQQTEQARRELDDLRKQLEGDRDALNVQGMALETERQNLVESQRQLESDRTRLAEQQAELESRMQELARHAEQLHVQREEQRRAATTHDERTCALDVREQELTQRQQKLRDEQKALDTSRTDLSEREQALAARETSIAQREAALIQDEQQIDAAQAALTQQRNSVDCEKQSKVQAETKRLSLEREALEVQEAALAAERAQLESDRNALAEEKQSWRKEIEERDETDRSRQHTELRARQAELDAMHTQLAADRGDLAEASARLQTDRQDVELSQSEVQAERARLSEQAQLLESDRHKLEQIRDELDRRQMELKEREAAFQQTHDEFWSARRQLECDPENTFDSEPNDQSAGTAADQQAFLERLRASVLENAEDHEEPGESESESCHAAMPHARPRETTTATESPAADCDLDDETAHLRSELASLFGIPATAGRTRIAVTEEEADEAREADRVVRPRSARSEMSQDASAVSDAESHLAEDDAESAFDAGSLPEESSVASSEDDVSVQSYMQRLLANSRKNASQAHGSRAAVPESAEPEEESEIVPEPVREPGIVTEKKARKLNDEEKASLRANIHSFRELANHSARTAIAKHNITRKSSTLRWMVLMNAVGWGTAVLVVLSGLLGINDIAWLGVPLVIICSVLSLLTCVRIQEIKNFERRKSAAKAAALAEENEEDEADEASDSGKGPLSFL